MRKQLEISGTEVVRDVEIDADLEAWLAQKAKLKTMAEAVKLRHEVLCARLQERGVTVYPYVDDDGKRRQIRIDATPRLKSEAAPREQKSDAREQKEPERVEHRKVSRASVESEIDPFSSTRAAMDGAS